jgi:hypothetical protein
MNFRIRGLDARQFDHLFALSDPELAEHGAVRRIADGPRPCRISLTDATPGDELILVNYEHHHIVCDLPSTFVVGRKRSMLSGKSPSSYANARLPYAALMSQG